MVHVGRSSVTVSVLLVGAIVLAGVAGCKKKPAATTPQAEEGEEISRGEIEMSVRASMGRVEGDICAKADWLRKLLPRAQDLQVEVVEELLAEQEQGCRKQKGVTAVAAAPAMPGTAPDAAPDATAKVAASATPEAAKPDAAKEPAKPEAAAKAEPAVVAAVAERRAPPAEPVTGACTRRRAEADLAKRDPKKKLTRALVDAEFLRCFEGRIGTCQFALDAEIDEGLACWRQDPWPEVPAAVNAEDIGKTAMCLVELKGVIADLRRCRTKKPADRDACVAPYVGFAPACPLLAVDRVWKAFPGREDIERVAKADAERRAPWEKKKAAEAEKAAKLKAEQDAKKAAEEAKLAKEIERCYGRTTVEFAEKLKAAPGPRTAAGCKYQVAGKVVSKNNAFVQLADPTGRLVVLIRTKEALAEGADVADRTGTFDSIEDVELADGTKQPYAVFKLDPAPKKPATK